MSAWKEWKNNLGETRPWDMINPNTEFVEDSVAESRMSLCLSCPELIKTTKQCKKCGCFMHLKTKLEKAVCPIGKW
jgi:hypothetical protein